MIIRVNLPSPWASLFRAAKAFRSRGPSENVRPRQKSSKVRQKYQSSCGGLQDQCFVFQGLKYTAKRYRWEEKVQKNAKFLLVDKGRLRFTKLSFEEFEIHEILIIGALGLFWNATKQRSFWRIFRYILYPIVKNVFEWKFMYLHVNISSYTFWDKLEHPDLRFVLNNFCHVLNRFYLRERGLRNA